MPEALALSNERLLWPEQARAELRKADTLSLLQRGLLNQRIGNLNEAEACLLAALSTHSGENPQAKVTALELLCGIHFRFNRLKVFTNLLSRAERLARDNQIQDPALLLRQRQLKLAMGETSGLFVSKSQQWPQGTPFELLLEFQLLLLTQDRAIVSERLKLWPDQLSSPEALELKAYTLKWLGRLDEARAIIDALLKQTTGSPSLWREILEINLLTDRGNGMALATALRLHPRDSGIATHRVLIHLGERQAAWARQSAFKERLLYSVGKPCKHQQQSDANLLAAIELTGRADLLTHLHPSLLQRLEGSTILHANLAMQLASIASPAYGQRVEELAKSYPSRDTLPARPHRSKLRVGLIGPDFNYHPVGRFILMLVHAGFGRRGELHLVNTGKAAMEQFRYLSHCSLHEIRAQPPEQRLKTLRALQLDVAIDLAGWTGENNGWVFAKGVAPLQVNYLGYFASLGLPSMDVWLGDHALFPDPMQEWHSERIVRLERPFLAWQPHPGLPEGKVEVPAAPKGPIRFGSFNNVRKLSAATLQLWGRILEAIPDAQLTLKAYASDDPGVVQLVERRMRTCGLDPDRVVWLPSCPAPIDHLRQYGLIDVALDPFPNGGCTTSCEALWMGVPVITLCGSHYVSRMSTAVLQGAQLQEWIAESTEHYLQLAQKAADQLSTIRANRRQLRAHVQASPLGNAEDLAQQLWDCLEQLV